VAATVNIARMAERAARHYPDKPAILFEDRGLTYRELDRGASRAAHALAKRGIEVGHRVALYLPNIPAFAVAYLAVQKLGAIVVSASAMLITDELAAQNVLMNGGFAAAATLVLHRCFDAARCAAAIEEHRVTIVTGVPTIYITLLNAGVRPAALASVRLYKSAAATIPLEIARRWRDTYGQPVMEGYGLTETSPAATFNHEHEYRVGSVGTPIDLVDMRVVDEEEREVPPGAWGEVVFRGPNVMLGYWNRPEDTRHAMRGGWFHTGTSATRTTTGISTWWTA
jgi:acyl-CoA synthetase (AMP-forming)/AMP-acid ligase II